MQRRTIETNFTEEDSRIEGTLRPQRLSEYIGQTKIKESLGISIAADQGHQRTGDRKAGRNGGDPQRT